MKVAIYARTSTSQQLIETQLESMRLYADARGLSVFHEYADEGVSGAKDRRPALDKLMADARRRCFDVICISRIDRLARSVRNLTQIAGELEALGVELIVVDQGVDTTTPIGKLAFNILGSIAEFERDLIRERTRAGMASARRRGARFGPAKAIRGPDCFTVERLLGKTSQAAIARELGVSAATVSRYAARLRAAQATA